MRASPTRTILPSPPRALVVVPRPPPNTPGPPTAPATPSFSLSHDDIPRLPPAKRAGTNCSNHLLCADAHAHTHTQRENRVAHAYACVYVCVACTRVCTCAYSPIRGGGVGVRVGRLGVGDGTRDTSRGGVREGQRRWGHVGLPSLLRAPLGGHPLLRSSRALPLFLPDALRRPLIRVRASLRLLRLRARYSGFSYTLVYASRDHPRAEISCGSNADLRNESVNRGGIRSEERIGRPRLRLRSRFYQLNDYFAPALPLIRRAYPRVKLVVV